MTGSHTDILNNLAALLYNIGSANDAEDHGYLADAAQMRSQACAGIRSLLAEHPFLSSLLPSLASELDSGHILGFGWATLLDAVEHTLQEAGKPCEVCGSLNDEEYACQKYGWEEHNTCLPPATSRLKMVRDFKPGSDRALQLWQCPQCQMYFLYRSDYEYLVNGTEDVEFLTRLSPEQAADYLNRPG
jgi:hypothetical protein